MQLITQNSQTKKLIESITKEAADIKLAVAFWGKGASETIKRIKNKKVKIICNLESGATNPYEIIEIGKMIGYKNIRSVKKLHAKVYLTNNKMIIGSSNFSANGLSLEGDETNKLIEANLLIEDKMIIQETKVWFNNLWINAKHIDERYCEKFIDKWLSNRKQNANQKKESDFFKAFENGSFSGDKFFITVDIYETTKNEDKIAITAANEISKNDLFYAGKILDYWYDYDWVPRDAIILSYGLTKKGNLIFEGLLKALPKKYDKKGFQFSYYVKYNALLSAHKKQIGKILKQNIEKMKIKKYGLEMSMDEFYKRFKPKE